MGVNLCARWVTKWSGMQLTLHFAKRTAERWLWRNSKHISTKAAILRNSEDMRTEITFCGARREEKGEEGRRGRKGGGGGREEGEEGRRGRKGGGGGREEGEEGRRERKGGGGGREERETYSALGV